MSHSLVIMANGYDILSDKKHLKQAKELNGVKEVTEMKVPIQSKCIGRNDRRVLVIYTGGTIGMVANEEGVLAPKKNMFERMIRDYPQLNDRCLYEQRCNEMDFDYSLLILPKTSDVDTSVL